MSLILLATACSGVLASKLFLYLDIDNFVLRYPLAVLFAYAVFFFCIKLWLMYVSSGHRSDSSVLDWIDIPTSTGRNGGGGMPSVQGGGGQFSGAGASGSFDGPLVGEASLPTVSDGSSEMLGGVGDTVAEAAGALGEEGGFMAVVVLSVLAAVVAAILGGAVYVISEAPVILSEAAFEGVLALSLLRKTRLIDDEDWIGSIFRTTWIPFAITLAVTLIAALVLHSYFPDASRLAEISR